MNQKTKDIPSYEAKKWFGNNMGIIISDYLTYNENEEGEMRLHNRYSRFGISVLNPNLCCNAYIPYDKIDGMMQDSLSLNSLWLQKQCSVNKGQMDLRNFQLAFDTRLPSAGPAQIRGKTPVEVLKEYGDRGKNELINQSENFWKPNLSLYPKNEVYIKAVQMAVFLYDSGRLNEDNRKGITIFSAKQQLSSYKKREDGRCFAFDLEIKWFPESPDQEKMVEITCKNYWTFYKKINNFYIMDSSENSLSDLKTVTCYLSRTNWLSFIGFFERRLNAFENEFRSIARKKLSEQFS